MLREVTYCVVDNIRIKALKKEADRTTNLEIELSCPLGETLARSISEEWAYDVFNEVKTKTFYSR